MPTARVETLITRLQKGHMKTQEILGSLTAEQWRTVVYDEHEVWDVRALLAHFVSAERRLRELAQDVVSGGPGAPEGFYVHLYNAEEQKRLKDQSPQELLAALAEDRGTTVDWVSTLDDGLLDRIGRHPVLGEITVEAMILAIYGHQLLHMRELRVLLRQKGG
jgi:hypothetical protein